MNVTSCKAQRRHIAELKTKLSVDRQLKTNPFSVKNAKSIGRKKHNGGSRPRPSVDGF